MSSEMSASVLEDALAEARADDWRARAAVLRAELEAETDKARAALLAYELGELSERNLHDEPGAVKAYGRALQSDPSYRPNLWAIRRVFYRRGLWPNLQKLIDAEIRFARSEAERADLYVEKAQILEDRSADRTGARDAYERAIALQPAHVPALLGRERIAFAEGDGDALLRLWRLLGDATVHPGRKAAYLLDLSRLQAQADIPRALAILDEAAALAPSPGVDPLVIARERERLAEASGDAETFLAALETRISLTADGKEVAALRRHQARVAGGLGGTGDLERAWQYLELAAAAAPDEPLLAFDMADLAEDSGKLERLAAILAHLLALETHPQRQLALSLRRADALTRAGRNDEAEVVLDEIVARAPGYLPVLELRERSALAQGDAERLARIRLAEAVAARMGTAFGGAPEPDLGWSAAAYTAAGDLYDLRLGRPEEARAAYQQALEAVPSFPPAVEALAGLALRAGRISDAVMLLEAQVEKDPSRAEELLERLTLIYERDGKPAEALSALERLAARRSEDETLWFRLERAYEAVGRHEERAGLLLRIAERVDDAPRRAAILAEVGRIHDTLLGNPEGAVAAYRASLALAPGDRVARGALIQLFRRGGRWEELAAELRADADTADGAGASRALRAAAAVLDRKLGQTAEAAHVYRELLDRAPGDPGAVRALAGALPESPELAAVLEVEAGIVPRGSAAAQALVRLGELYERLGSPEDAAAAHRRSLENGPGAHAAWALFQLAARHGDAAALAEALEALSAASQDEAFRTDLAEELAWLAEGDDAATRFDALARQAPDRRGVELGQALVAARRKDSGELAAALVAQAERTSDARVGAALTLRAATLREVAAAMGAPIPAGATDAQTLAAQALARTPDDAGALVAAVERAAPADEAARRERRGAERLRRRAGPSARQGGEARRGGAGAARAARRGPRPPRRALAPPPLRGHRRRRRDPRGGRAPTGADAGDAGARGGAAPRGGQALRRDARAARLGSAGVARALRARPVAR
jgi:tetratricopeptide (TPR) repeat protein